MIREYATKIGQILTSPFGGMTATVGVVAGVANYFSNPDPTVETISGTIAVISIFYLIGYGIYGASRRESRTANI